jgi:hypothetical protein
MCQTGRSFIKLPLWSIRSAWATWSGSWQTRRRSSTRPRRATGFTGSACRALFPRRRRMPSKSRWRCAGGFESCPFPCVSFASCLDTLPPCPVPLHCMFIEGIQLSERHLSCCASQVLQAATTKAERALSECKQHARQVHSPDRLAATSLRPPACDPIMASPDSPFRPFRWIYPMIASRIRSSCLASITGRDSKQTPGRGRCSE